MTIHLPLELTLTFGRLVVYVTVTHATFGYTLYPPLLPAFTLLPALPRHTFTTPATVGALSRDAFTRTICTVADTLQPAHCHTLPDVYYAPLPSTVRGWIYPVAPAQQPVVTTPVSPSCPIWPFPSPPDAYLWLLYIWL